MTPEQQGRIRELVLGHLGLTPEKIQALKEAAEIDAIEREGIVGRYVIEDEYDWGDEVCDDEEEDEDVAEDITASQARIDLLGDVVDNTLEKLDAGIIVFENGQEMIATIQAVSMYEDLRRRLG